MDYIIHHENGRKMKNRNNKDVSRYFSKYGTTTMKKLLTRNEPLLSSTPQTWLKGY